MGDRGNICILDDYKPLEHDPVFLYTHWGGSVLKQTLAAALARCERGEDGPYLARIIFCQMVGPDAWDGETGFGISTQICDNEYPVLVVQSGREPMVYECECRWEEKERTEGWPKIPRRTDEGHIIFDNRWTFEDFIKKFGPI